MKLNFICQSRLTKDCLLPQGDRSCNWGTSVVLTPFVHKKKKKECLEVVECFSCNSGFWATGGRGRVVHVFPGCSLGGLIEPQLQVVLVGAKCCWLRQQRLVQGLWWWDAKELLSCELLQLIAWPGLWREQSCTNSASSWAAGLCPLFAGLGSQAYTGRSQMMRSSLGHTSWHGIVQCFCERELCNLKT